MKRIIIVRHAKSVPYGYDDDFNRGLKDRGISDSELISSKLNTDAIKADRIISSPAKRAMHTAKIYATNLNYNTDNIQYIQELYDGVTTQEFIDLIHELKEDVETVFIFGHNPTVYYLCNNLVKYFNSDMPTSSTVSISFDATSWKDIAARQGKIEFQLVPRMFK